MLLLTVLLGVVVLTTVVVVMVRMTAIMMARVAVTLTDDCDGSNGDGESGDDGVTIVRSQ